MKLKPIRTLKRKVLKGLVCLNPACKYHKKEGSIVLVEKYGKKKKNKLYECGACRKRFTEHRGTAFEGLRTPTEKVTQALKLLVEGNGIRGTGRIMGVKKDTVRLWLLRACQHCDRVSEHLMKELKLSQVQIDELWTFVKKKTAIPIGKRDASS